MKKLLLTLLLALTMGVGAAWATTTEYSATKGSISTANKTFKTDDLSWTYTGYSTLGWNGTAGKNGYQISATADKTVTSTFTTSSLSDKVIESVVLKGCCTAKAGSVTISVKVGDTNFTTSDGVLSGQTVSSKTFTGNASGNIVITCAPTASDGRFTFMSVTITYSEKSLTPSAITSTPAADGNNVITINKGETVTFTSENATSLKYSTDLENYTTEPSNTYTFTPDETIETFHIFPLDQDGNAYDGETEGFEDLSFLGSIQVNIVAPEQVVSAPVAVNEEIEIVRGKSITFSSRYAAKLKIEVDGQDAQTIDGNEYVYTPTEASIITVTPIGADGNEYADCALMVSVSFKAAPLCGTVTFDPADGSAVFPGSAVTISCENAVKIVYAVGNGAETTVDGASAQVTINEACTITAYGVNADGIDSDIAEASYTIKEADKYALVNDMSQIKSGAKYILLGVSSSTNKVALMGAVSSTGKYRDVVFLNEKTDIISLTPNLKNVAVFTIESQSNGKYTIKVDGEDYLGVKSISTTSNVDFSYYTTPDNNTYFTLTLKDNGTIAIQNGNYLQFNGNNGTERFKPYTGSQTNPYLYRLIDEEYAEAPSALYIHGHFWDRYYKFDEPVEMTAEEGGKVFTATNILIGGNSEAIADGKPLSYVFSDAKAESAAPESRAADETIDWSAINGNVYHQNGVTHTANTEKHAEIEPFEVSEGHYDFTADFSGFAPKFTVTENTTTGVENIAIDASEAEYFNLQGVHVAEPTNGIYIRRQGKTVTKVFVK